MSKTTEDRIKEVKENHDERQSKLMKAIKGGYRVDNIAEISHSRKEDETLVKTLMFEHVHQKHAISREIEVGKEVKQLKAK